MNIYKFLEKRIVTLIITQTYLEALKDLHLAVELSEGKERAGIQAFCQRGALYRRWSKMTRPGKISPMRLKLVRASLNRSWSL